MTTAPHACCLLLLALTGAAEAAVDRPFREAPPASMRLLPGLAQKQEADPLTPPPLLPAPGGEAEAGRNAQPSSPGVGLSDLTLDPYSGTFVGREVGMGALGVLLADVASVGAGVLVFVGVLAATGGGGSGFQGAFDALAAIFLGAAVAGILDFFLAPIAAAVGAFYSADGPTNNGMFGAMLGAFAAQLLWTAASVGVGVAMSGLAAAVGTGGQTALSLVSAASGLIFLVLHYVGLPLAASMGMHWGRPIEAAGNARRPERLPTSPAELYARDRPSGAGTIATWIF